MSDDSEFGPWVLHDGKGCPCVGKYVQADLVGGSNGKLCTLEGMAGLKGGICWDWRNFGKATPKGRVSKVIRFRIRRPKGMAILNAILADLPAPVKTDGVIA